MRSSFCLFYRLTNLVTLELALTPLVTENENVLYQLLTGLPPCLHNLQLIGHAATMVAVAPSFPPGLKCLGLYLIDIENYKKSYFRRATWGPLNDLRYSLF